jgi:hypothetical protein
VPTFPAFPSSKNVVWARGNGSTGSSGYGQICCYPLALAVNDANSVTVSNSAWAGSAIAQSPGAGVDGITTNAPYATADIAGDAVNYRLVATGIRLRYVGTQLEMGGSVYAATTPSHTSLNGATAADFLALDRVEQAPFDRSWVAVTWTPVKDSETTFITAYGAGTPHLAVLIKAASTTPVAFEFEVFAHIEYIGSNVRQKTASHADVLGFQKAATAVSALHTRAVDAISNNKFSIDKFANQVLSQVTPENVVKAAVVASRAFL